MKLGPLNTTNLFTMIQQIQADIKEIKEQLSTEKKKTAASRAVKEK